MAPQGAGYVCKIEWVDPSDACSKKRALAHADQESRRRRRWMQQEQLLKARKSTLETFGIAEGSPQSQPASPCPSSPGQMIMDFTPGQVRKGSATEYTGKTATNGVRKGQPFDQTSKRPPNVRKIEPLHVRRSSTSSATDDIGDEIGPDGAGIRKSLYADPQTWLSSSRKDSFQSLFSGLDHEAQRLVDHCAYQLFLIVSFFAKVILFYFDYFSQVVWKIMPFTNMGCFNRYDCVTFSPLQRPKVHAIQRIHLGACISRPFSSSRNYHHILCHSPGSFARTERECSIHPGKANCHQDVAIPHRGTNGAPPEG